MASPDRVNGMPLIKTCSVAACRPGLDSGRSAIEKGEVHKAIWHYAYYWETPNVCGKRKFARLPRLLGLFYYSSTNEPNWFDSGSEASVAKYVPLIEEVNVKVKPTFPKTGSTRDTTPRLPLAEYI